MTLDDDYRPEIFRRSDIVAMSTPHNREPAITTQPASGTQDWDGLMQFVERFTAQFEKITKLITEMTNTSSGTAAVPEGDAEPVVQGEPGATGITGGIVFDRVIQELGKIPAELPAGLLLKMAGENRNKVIEEIDKFLAGAS
jgi:hypothetical protein